jgi:hypothetical protein
LQYHVGSFQRYRQIPGEQHLAVFGDLILTLFGRSEIVWVDVINKNFLDLRSKLAGFHSKFHELVEPYVAMRQKLRWIDRIVG